jgi:fructokinase
MDIISTPSGTKEHPGGSPANVALGLARLGARTSFLTALGPDARGEAIAARLDTAGVTVMAESWCLPTTSTAAAEIDDDGSARYTFDVSWQLRDEIQLPLAHHLHLGSIAAFVSPGADQAEELLLRLRPEATVSFDPNIRPALVGDPAVARKRFERIASMADLVKLSDEDAEFLYPGHSPGDVVKAMAELGPISAVTRGGDGSLLLSAGDVVEVEPVQTVVVDTVGAGDSYMSALLWALLEAGRPRLEPLDDAELAAAGRFAARAAALTVSRAGAEPPTLRELTEGVSRE